MDYIKDIDQLTACTTTYIPPTKEETKELIIKFAKLLANKKWYQLKGPTIRKLKYWTTALLKIEKRERQLSNNKKHYEKNKVYSLDRI